MLVVVLYSCPVYSIFMTGFLLTLNHNNMTVVLIQRVKSFPMKVPFRVSISKCKPVEKHNCPCCSARVYVFNV